MEDKLLTKYEVMDYLNISRRHFEKLVTEENLPIIKITQNKRYMRLSDLNRYLNTKMVNKPQETTRKYNLFPMDEYIGEVTNLSIIPSNS